MRGSETAAAGHAPVAVVWCRQVDNEAESPGYTTIPEEFPGRRETLETIRIVGNLTVNVADTHDYWDPDPASPLSYYPNLFLYPAAGGRYTCVGRMFLSTEDRPRIGMKTLVFDTARLVASGDFNATVLRAHATMGGRSADERPAADPDQSVYQGVGEGFLFHRGSTEPVVLIASDQWEAANRVALQLVAELPTALVALGAVLVFPYFLPVAKVDLHQLTEQLPLALAVMRVPRGEAAGERHQKRVAGWDAASVTLRDLTRPTTARASKDALPLVLQYARDRADDRLAEIARRVDLVEGPRLGALLTDPDRQAGRDRRKEMWRIGTAMETAALLLSRPRGRTVPTSREAARRAQEYVAASPRSGGAVPAPSTAPPGDPISAAAAPLPPWLAAPVEVEGAASPPGEVPVSVQNDPSVHAPTPPAEPPASLPEEVEHRLRSTLDARLAEASEGAARALAQSRHDLSARLAALEARPVADEAALGRAVEQRVRAAVDPSIAGLPELARQAVRAASEQWTASFRSELDRIAREAAARGAKSEEELRASLAAQLDLELREVKEQGTALREQGEANVRAIVDRLAQELDTKRAKEGRELEQRLAALVEGRAKDLEARLDVVVETRAKEAASRIDHELAQARAATDERLAQSVHRSDVEREARLAEMADTQSKSLAGLQVRMQSYLDQKLREEGDQERAKYVELLARLKGEVDQALARTIDSTRFDAAVRERVERAAEETRRDYLRAMGELESRLARDRGPDADRLDAVEQKLAERAEAIGTMEAKVRRDLDELDRRTQVLSDKMLPLVRKTWVRIEEIEKMLARSDDTEARFGQLRRDLGRELRRVETELRDEQAVLRRRLEHTMTTQSKVWMNLVRQLSESGAGFVPELDETPAGRRTADDVDVPEPRSGDPEGSEPFLETEEFPPTPPDPDLTGSPTTGRRRPAARGRGAQR